MGLKGIFKIFMKGAKAAGKYRGSGQKEAGGFDWPPGIRIGVYGHANAGKTVYFTVLNEECKISKKLGISVTDNATAGEFLTNYRQLWGLGTATGSGTMVDLRGEKKFPDPTTSDKLLQFNAIIDRKKKLAVVTYDYSGRAVAISGREASADKVTDFMSGCDGILFFMDPKILGAELESQAHSASFVNMLEQLAPLHSRLPIPVALVVTKADVLDGFSGDEQQVTLVNPEDEYVFSEDFELFLEKVLTGPRLAGNPSWAASVRNVLVKVKDFLRVVVGRTLDFQIFFVSATGQKPEKIGADIGRSIYAPPAKMKPTGTPEPFYWLLKSIMRNRRISAFRKVTRYAALISIIWIVLLSLPYLFHFKYLYTQPARVEQSVLGQYGGNPYSANEGDRGKIISEYGAYERSMTVRLLFDKFQTPARHIREWYAGVNQQGAEKDLNRLIDRFAAIVADTSLWPTRNPSDSMVILGDEHTRLVVALEAYHKGNETSILFVRSGRALVYWGLFSKGVANPSDTAIWQTIQQQVQTDRSLHKNDLSNEESRLGEAFFQRKVIKVQTAVAAKAATQLDTLISSINSKPSPDFRLDTAVARLRTLRANLDPAVDKQSITMIDNYLREADKWNAPRRFTYRIESVPGEGHLHIEVTPKGTSPTWSLQDQFYPGSKERTIQWKAGDWISIALDTLGQPEDWGNRSSDKVSFKGKFSIFTMEGDITFENARKKVTIIFNPSLREQIPELK